MDNSSLPKTPGIYLITNKVNGYFYLGSAVNIRSRGTAHRNHLIKGTHHNPKLQAAWNKYGEDSFDISILEHVTDIADLVTAEQRWLDNYKVSERDDTYNLCFVAYSSRGIKRSPESRVRLSMAAKRRGADPHMKAISSKNLTNYNLSKRGVPFTDVHRERIRQSNTGKHHSEATRIKLSKIKTEHPPRHWLGKHHSPETRTKMSVAHKGKCGALHNRSKPVIQMDMDNRVLNRYAGLSEASRITCIARTGIGNCIHGRSKSSGGFVWKFEKETD